MKRLYQALGLGTIVAILATPVVLSTPVLAELQQVGETVVQNLQREPQMKLELSAHKKVVTTDEQGKPVTTWQPLSGQAIVNPGDVLRYSLSGNNSSDRPVSKLVLTQPIPSQMEYVLKSATINQDVKAETTYSIDGGETFVANPTIEVKMADGTVEAKPAPAEMYTHVRWKFNNSVAAGDLLNATYQTTVK